MAHFGTELNDGHGRFALVSGVIAGMTVLGLTASLQYLGLQQFWATAVAVPAVLLGLYPVLRRWWLARVPFHQWALTVVIIGFAAITLHLLLLRL